MPSLRLTEAEFKRRFTVSRPRLRAAWRGARQDRIRRLGWICGVPQVAKDTKGRSEYADPEYDLAVDRIEASDAISAARRRHEDETLPPPCATATATHCWPEAQTDQIDRPFISFEVDHTQIADIILVYW
jgi:hypothetical protein